MRNLNNYSSINISQKFYSLLFSTKYNQIYTCLEYYRTYPVPNDQISGHHIFNLNNFEIRALS